MYSLKIFILFIGTAVTLFAQDNDKKWIPIKPINLNEVSKFDDNKSKLQADSKVIQNLTIIKNLLDHVNPGRLNTKENKNWYSFEPAEDN